MFGSYSYSEINKPLSYNKNVNSDNPSFDKYQNQDVNDKKNYYCGGKSTYAIGGMQMSNTPLSITYFSDGNMKKIQNLIKSNIHRESQGKFRMDIEQDESDLLVVMRYIFLEHAMHLPTHIKKQVNELNIKTINYIIPDMMTNIKQHYGYLKDISQPIKPIDRPMNVNRAGRKSLPSTTSVWGF
jgi:hypothetical protein